MKTSSYWKQEMRSPALLAAASFYCCWSVGWYSRLCCLLLNALFLWAQTKKLLSHSKLEAHDGKNKLLGSPETRRRKTGFKNHLPVPKVVPETSSKWSPAGGQSALFCNIWMCYFPMIVLPADEQCLALNCKRHQRRSFSGDGFKL